VIASSKFDISHLRRERQSKAARIVLSRCGNRTDGIRFRFFSNGSGQFDFLKEIGLDRDQINLYIVFFKSLIDFDWIKIYLISRINSDSDQIRSD
jgi:hypothetical protein